MKKTKRLWTPIRQNGKTGNITKIGHPCVARYLQQTILFQNLCKLINNAQAHTVLYGIDLFQSFCYFVYMVRLVSFGKMRENM